MFIELKPEKTIQELRVQLANSHGTAKQKDDTLAKTIKSLRTDLSIQNAKSGALSLNPHSGFPNQLLVIRIHQTKE